MREPCHCFEGTLLLERQEVVRLFLPLNEREGSLVGSCFVQVGESSFEPVSEYSTDKCNILIVIGVKPTAQPLKFLVKIFAICEL